MAVRTSNSSTFSVCSCFGSPSSVCVFSASFDSDANSDSVLEDTEMREEEEDGKKDEEDHRVSRARQPSKT